MQTRGDRTVAIAVISGIIALLLGACLGGIAGGVVGYALGRQSQSAGGLGEGFGLVPQLTPMPPRIDPFDLPRRFGGTQGVLVQQVIEDSPAERAGIRAGDLITQVDGAILDESHPLAEILNQHKPGDPLNLTVLRAGSTRNVRVTLGRRDDNPERPYLGIRFTASGIGAAATPSPQP